MAAGQSSEVLNMHQATGALGPSDGSHLVVIRALHHHAAAVVLTHNHPSGSVRPSGADEQLTPTLRAALLLVDVRVIDHVIVSGGASLSMAEAGLI
jgi:DNA repair protein RadC